MVWGVSLGWGRLQWYAPNLNCNGGAGAWPLESRAPGASASLSGGALALATSANLSCALRVGGQLYAQADVAPGWQARVATPLGVTVQLLLSYVACSPLTWPGPSLPSECEWSNPFPLNPPPTNPPIQVNRIPPAPGVSGGNFHLGARPSLLRPGTGQPTRARQSLRRCCGPKGRTCLFRRWTPPLTPCGVCR